MNLRLIGANTIKDVVPDMVDASNIRSHIVAVPGDRLYDSNCECLDFRRRPRRSSADMEICR